MQEAFGVVIFVVVAIAVVAAIWASSGTGALYRQIGRGGLSLDRDDDYATGRRPTAHTSRAVADEEIRQMLAARNARRAARGEEPLDIEAELARLTAPAIDPALEAEIRSLVVARNARRERRGQEPLDVEAEVARQVAELGDSD